MWKCRVAEVHARKEKQVVEGKRRVSRRTGHPQSFGWAGLWSLMDSRGTQAWMLPGVRNMPKQNGR